jgi:hypothetical protein
MITMYDLTIPPLLRGLKVTARYVDRAQDEVDRGDISEAEILEARLAPDMLPLSAQVQRVSDNAKNGAARLIGGSAPAMADNEKSLAELKVRMLKTIEYLESLERDDFSASEEREVKLVFGSTSAQMMGIDYLTKQLLPNFYFHIATMHGLMRLLGIEVGKRDYLRA